MMRVAPIIARNRLLQSLLHLERCFADRKTQAVRHAKHMRIDRNRRCMKGDAHHNICCLASDSGESLQRLEVRRNLSTVFLQ